MKKTAAAIAAILAATACLDATAAVRFSTGADLSAQEKPVNGDGLAWGVHFQGNEQFDKSLPFGLIQRVRFGWGDGQGSASVEAGPSLTFPVGKSFEAYAAATVTLHSEQPESNTDEDGATSCGFGAIAGLRLVQNDLPVHLDINVTGKRLVWGHDRPQTVVGGGIGVTFVIRSPYGTAR